jgi:hypothetical protein
MPVSRQQHGVGDGTGEATTVHSSGGEAKMGKKKRCGHGVGKVNIVQTRVNMIYMWLWNDLAKFSQLYIM